MTAPELLTFAAVLVALAIFGASIETPCEYGCTRVVSVWR